MGFQGASLAAHQREIKVEDDERGQEEGGLQQQHCFRDHARRARGGEETRTLWVPSVIIMQCIILHSLFSRTLANCPRTLMRLLRIVRWSLSRTLDCIDWSKLL